jgi:hypothetical protein
MNAKLTKLITPMFFAGAAATAIALAPSAVADPPPPCTNPDGTACEVVTPNGASGDIPGPVQGGADGAAGTAGGSVPGGVWGEAGPNGAHGCVPIYGCKSVGGG